MLPATRETSLGKTTAPGHLLPCKNQSSDYEPNDVLRRLSVPLSAWPACLGTPSSPFSVKPALTQTHPRSSPSPSPRLRQILTQVRAEPATPEDQNTKNWEIRGFPSSSLPCVIVAFPSLPHTERRPIGSKINLSQYTVTLAVSRLCSLSGSSSSFFPSSTQTVQTREMQCNDLCVSVEHSQSSWQALARVRAIRGQMSRRGGMPSRDTDEILRE